MASSVLFAGTARGVAAVNLVKGTVHKLGLESSFINHVAKLHNTLAVACPQFGPLHALQQVGRDTHPQHEPGLHLFDLPTGTSSFERTPCSTVWQGDARSCRLVPGQAPSSPPCIFIGTEPADVFVSEDRGQLWINTQSFASISTRSTWTFPPEPHQPHVLSIDPAELNDGTPAFIAGIEVGGVLSTTDYGKTWLQHPGLYEDVHSVRSDPFDRRRWLAVTGGGMSGKPGMYLTEDGGDTWKGITPVPGQRLYVVGLSWNPYTQGELLLTAGFGPPSRGTMVLHSTDGGLTCTDVTAGVKAAVPAADVEAAFRLTPVPIWVEGGAVLGLCNGQLLCSEGDVLSKWRTVADLGARINALASGDDVVSPSTVMH